MGFLKCVTGPRRPEHGADVWTDAVAPGVIMGVSMGVTHENMAASTGLAPAPAA
jgi:hypothetical protein